MEAAGGAEQACRRRGGVGWAAEIPLPGAQQSLSLEWEGWGVVRPVQEAAGGQLLILSSPAPQKVPAVSSLEVGGERVEGSERVKQGVKHCLRPHSGSPRCASPLSEEREEVVG